VACVHCGPWRLANNSSRNRHGPTGLGAAARTGLAEPPPDLLPVGYLLVSIEI
jgi:hypothetical protein